MPTSFRSGRPRLAVMIACSATLAFPAVGSAAPKNPCAKQPELKVLARDGASRIVEPPGDYDVFACTPARPRGLLLAEGGFSEPCGSNSSRTVGVPDKGGAALAGRYALIAVNVVNDNCGEDDGYRVLRWDLASGRRTVVAAGRDLYAGDVRVNAVGTSVWNVDDRELRIAAIGETPKLLLAGGAGSGSAPIATRMGSGRRPVLTAVQGTSTFQLDTRRHLAARARCGAATKLVTSLIAVGPRRICTLATGRSVTRRRCTQARGTTVLCGTRLVDARTNRVLLEHPGLAGRQGRVGLVEYTQDVTDVIAVPGGRAVIVREGPETKFEPVEDQFSSTETESFSEIVALLPGGKERVLRRTPTYKLRQLQVEGGTIHWRETGNDGGGPRSAPLPPAG